jgi:hypothetical protein
MEHIKTFKEIAIEISNKNKLIIESPQAMPGDAPFEELSFRKISTISQKGMEKSYALVKKDFIELKDEKFDLYKARSHEYYVLGKFYKEKENKNRFAVIFDISFKIENELRTNQKQLKNKKVIIIETVHTSKDYRYNGIASSFYKSILKDAIIISDQIQYEGAVSLWKSLIEDHLVYAYDIIEDKIISKVSTKTPINHIWSSDESKRKIRLVLVK